MYEIKFSVNAEKDLAKIDPQVTKRIEKFLKERISSINDPRSIGEALKGEKLGKYWKYRVGDYRLICEIKDNQLVVLVISVGHRRDVYRR